MRRVLVMVLVFGLGGLVSVSAQQVAGWRGNGSGSYPDAKPPLTWARDKNVVWATPMPDWGNGSPILVGDRLFVGAEPAKLICFNAADGKISWQADNGYEEVFPADKLAKAKVAEDLQKQFNDLQNRISKKPHDLEQYRKMAELCQKIAGEPANEENFKIAAELAKPPTHNVNGYSSPTPVSDGKQVYVLTNFGTLAAYSLDGKRRWLRLVNKPNHGWGHSASPVIVDGKVVVHIANQITALNPDDGKTIWEAKGNGTWGTPFATRIGGQPALVTTGGDLIRMSDGKVIAQRIVDLPWGNVFEQDGVLYYMDERGCGAVKLPSEMADQVKVEKLWSANTPKDRYYASPVIVNGVLYNVNQKGELTAVDIAKGDILYTERVKLKGTVYTGIIVIGDHLLMAGESGDTLIVKAGRKFEKVAENSLEPYRGTPWPTGSRLYIRTHKTLYCLGQ